MKDLFSGHSKQYAAFRPTYPKSLYDFILKNVKSKKTAWDCACGNGQVAKDLAEYFEKVFATDHSEKQLESAIKKANIEYSVASAERSGFNDGQFDLITVGQALHWLNIPVFFDEARRVLKPDGVIAVWGYSLVRINDDLDLAINEFYNHIIGPYWDKERKHVDNQYSHIDFPFKKIDVPSFEFSFEWTLTEFQGYLSTWSSVQKFIKQHQHNPVDDLILQIRHSWGDGRREVSFPLFVLMGKV